MKLLLTFNFQLSCTVVESGARSWSLTGSAQISKRIGKSSYARCLLALIPDAISLLLNYFCLMSSYNDVVFFLADKMEKPEKPDPERGTPSKQGSSSSSSISSPPGGGQQQVCVVLQPPLPSLSNRASSPTHLGSLADNVRPSSVPIILAPSPALSSRPRSSPQGSRSSTPTDPGPKQLEMSEEGRDETPDGEPAKPGPAASPASPQRPKASIHDI